MADEPKQNARRRPTAPRPAARHTIRAALHRELPAPLAEVLVPAIQWRVARNRITVIAANPVWAALFREHGVEALQRAGLDGGEEVQVLSRLDEDGRPGIRQQSLSTFLGDPGNEFPVSAARQILEAPGLEHNPFFVHGPTGCGKSHLLSGLAQEFRAILGRDAVVELTAREWVGTQAQQLAERGTSVLRERLTQAAVILMDDVQDLGNRSVAQEQLFHLINHGLEAGQQLVFAAKTTPKHLAEIEDRLITRFSWGLVVAMDLPTIETRVALLRELAGAVIDETGVGRLGELVEMLAPDMHHVVQLADRFLRGERVRVGEDKASFDTVLDEVARAFDLRPGDIAGRRRHRAITQARQTALLLGRRLTGHSLVALGGMVGGRDHSTVLHLIRQAEERSGRDPEYQRLITELTQRVLQ